MNIMGLLLGASASAGTSAAAAALAGLSETGKTAVVGVGAAAVGGGLGYWGGRHHGARAQRRKTLSDVLSLNGLSLSDDDDVSSDIVSGFLGQLAEAAREDFGDLAEVEFLPGAPRPRKKEGKGKGKGKKAGHKPRVRPRPPKE